MKQKFNYKKDKNEFTKEMLNDTLKYQKKYGFDIEQKMLHGTMKQMLLDILICKV